MPVKFHTAKNPTWVNASGDAVPFKFVPKVDRTKEALSAKIHSAALKSEEMLAALHKQMTEALEVIREEMLRDYELRNGKPKKIGKGTMTWFNFDRSLKVEAEMNEVVKWDGALMTEALALLNTYISSNMTEANQLIAELVKSAFANSKGMIDSAKVFQLLRYEDKIRAKPFQAACQLMKKAQSIDRSKLYMRVWEKQADGQYRNINLNFSSL